MQRIFNAFITFNKVFKCLTRRAADSVVKYVLFCFVNQSHISASRPCFALRHLS